MAYVPAAFASHADAIPQTAPIRHRGIFRRIMDAIIASQQRRADAQIARFLADRGTALNDDAEREIERRFLFPTRERI